jgi:hypothetical protein
LANQWQAASYPTRAMNTLIMRSTQTRHVLEIWRPYRSAENLQTATRVTQYESASGFGPFHTGDTFSHGLRNDFLGTIQHIHHRIGQEDADEVIHRTLLYLHRG